MKQNFIRSSDKETIDTLKNLGFKQIDEQNDVVTFINDKNLKFSNEVDTSKLQYTNMLCI